MCMQYQLKLHLNVYAISIYVNFNMYAISIKVASSVFIFFYKAY